MFCPTCGTEYEGNYCPNGCNSPKHICLKCKTEYAGAFCPKCGTGVTGQKPQKPPKDRRWIIPVVVIGAIAIIGGTGVIISSITFSNDISNAQSCIAVGEYEEAQEILDGQMSTNYSYETIYLTYADLYLKQGDPLSALDILEKGSERASEKDNIEAKQAEINTKYADEISKAKKDREEAQRKADEEAARQAEEQRQQEANKEQKAKEDYIASCKEIAYTDLARNPEKYKGQSFKFTGEVIQTMEPTFGNTVLLRINVTKNGDDSFAFYSDTIVATIYLPSGSDRILEGDIVKIYGDCDGLYSYTSIFDKKVSLPKINIKYCEIQK